MFSGPNTIDFRNLLDNLGGKIVENLPVILTVLGIIILYIPLVIYCRSLDKKDAARVRIHKTVLLEFISAYNLYSG